MGVQGGGPGAARGRAWNAPMLPALTRAAAACRPARQPAGPRGGFSLRPPLARLAPFGFQRGTQWAAETSQIGRGISEGREQEQRQPGGEADGLGKGSVCEPGSTPAEKATGFLTRFMESRHSPRPLTRISCAWELFREIPFIPGVFFKSSPCKAKYVLKEKKKKALPSRISGRKHRSKPDLKTFLVKSYKSSLIISLQGRSFIFTIYLFLSLKKIL